MMILLSPYGTQCGNLSLDPILLRETSINSTSEGGMYDSKPPLESSQKITLVLDLIGIMKSRFLPSSQDNTRSLCAALVIMSTDLVVQDKDRSPQTHQIGTDKRCPFVWTF